MGRLHFDLARCQATIKRCGLTPRSRQLGQGSDLAQAMSQPRPSQGSPREKDEVVPLAVLQHSVRLRFTVPKVVLVLHRDQGHHLPGLFDLGDREVADSDIPHESLVHGPLRRPHHLRDGIPWIWPVELPQGNRRCTALDLVTGANGSIQVLGCAVDLPTVLRPPCAALGGHQNRRGRRPHRAGDQTFVVVQVVRPQAVRVGRVDQ